MSDVQRRLRERRLELGVSLSELAARASVRKSFVADLEAGRQRAGVRTLIRLTEILNIEAEEWVPLYLAEETRCRPLLHLAASLLEARKIDLASRVLSRARVMNRHQYRGRYNGDLYYLYGRLEYAKRRYRRAVRWFRAHDRALSHAPASSRRWTAAYNYALALARTGHPATALQLFERAAKGFVDKGLTREAGVTYLARANLLLDLRAYSEARTDYRRASFYLRGHALHFEAELGIVLCSWATRGPHAVHDELLRLSQRPELEHLQRARALHNLGVVLRQLDRPFDAIPYLLLALGQCGSDHPALKAATLSELCLCYALVGELSRAREALDQYKAIEGSLKGQAGRGGYEDFARRTGVDPLDEPLPTGIVDEHELRLHAALSVLQRKLSVV